MEPSTAQMLDCIYIGHYTGWDAERKGRFHL